MDNKAQAEGFPDQPSFLPHEIMVLGLGGAEFLIPGQSVSSVFGFSEDDGLGKVVIYVKDIQVTEIDPVSNQAQYRITGMRTLRQNWDLGGSHLDPTALQMSE